MLAKIVYSWQKNSESKTGIFEARLQKEKVSTPLNWISEIQTYKTARSAKWRSFCSIFSKTYSSSKRFKVTSILSIVALE